MADDGELGAARARLAEAHDLVARGRYVDAAGAFAAALDVLRARLGDDHPDVEELEADLDACRQMAEVEAFGREAGFRHWSRPEPDRDPDA